MAAAIPCPILAKSSPVPLQKSDLFSNQSDESWAWLDSSLGKVVECCVAPSSPSDAYAGSLPRGNIVPNLPLSAAFFSYSIPRSIRKQSVVEVTPEAFAKISGSLRSMVASETISHMR
jgi:hypothetical protein